MQSVAVITARGILDWREMGRIRAEVAALAELGKIEIVLALANVEFINHFACGLFLAMQALLGQHGGELKLAGVTPEVRKILRMAGAESVFEIYGSVEDAIDSFSKEWSPGGSEVTQ